MMDSQDTKELTTQRLDGAPQHHATKQSQRQNAASTLRLSPELSAEEGIPDADHASSVHPPLETTYELHGLDIADTNQLKSESGYEHRKAGVAIAVSALDALRVPPTQNLALAQDASRSPMYHSKTDSSLWQQISHVLVTNSEPEVVLRQIVQLIGESFGTDCYLVSRPNDQSEPQMVYWWQAARQAEFLPMQSLPENSFLKSWLNQSELMAIADLESPLQIGESEWNESPTRAILGGPTWFQGQRNGFVSLLRSQSYQWTSIELETLRMVTDQVAVAIAQVNLQHQARQQVLCQTLIEQLTVAIRNASELSQIFQLATDGISQALHADRSLMVTLKYSDPMVKSRSAERAAKVRATVVCEWLNPLSASINALSQQELEVSGLNRSFWVSECTLCQQVFLDPTQPVAIANCTEVATLNSTLAPVLDSDQFSSLLITPLESQGTVLGFLILQHRQPRTWQSGELAWVELVGAQISTAIIQSQTLRQVQALVEERTAQLQRSLEVQAKLYERTRRQVDQLRHLNQLKDEFLSTMSHELLTPLTSMTLAIRMLRQNGLAPERHHKYLDILEQQCNQETKLINDLLALQKLESNQAPIQLQKVDLKSVISDLTTCFEDQWAAKELSLTLDLPQRSVMLQTDCESLHRILIELLTNAGKYADPKTTVHLRLAHQVNAEVNQTVVTLCNTGHGISSEELPFIFDKFRRGQGVTQQAIQGTGLGLALVKCLVQHLNGTITVASEAIESSITYETCFTLTLPSVFNSGTP